MKRFDMSRVTASKNEFRRELAERPIAEKLRILDELRRRARMLGSAIAVIDDAEGGGGKNSRC